MLVNKKIIKFAEKAIGDYTRPLQERLFRLISIIGATGLATGAIVGFFSGESLTNVIAMAIAFAVLVSIVIISIKAKRIQVGSIVLAAIAMFVVLPFNFVSAGGIYGGAPIWFIVGFVLATIVVQGKAKYFLMVGGVLTLLGCYYFAYHYPTKIIQHTLNMAYIDSLITVVLVSFVVCGMLLFQNAVYRSENRKTEKQKEEIEELNRAQNRFFSSMSHEIRTPINTIIGLNEMILRETVTDEVAYDAKNIQSASKMLLSLINDILDMSKIESGKMDIVPVEYDVGSMLSDVVNMIWIRAQDKGLEFHINVDENIPARLFGDEVRIKQIIINLLNNAVKYTPDGSVTLSIQTLKKEDDTAYITYTVSDTGMGIKKENIPHLFSAFKRVDEEKNRHIEGTGLGLSIVKQLVVLMGGEIEVNSVYTKGSTFMVTLPQKIVSTEAIGELDLETKHTMHTREHYRALFEAPKANVLIVDDNDANLMVATKLLQDTKVGTDTASSGEECLKKTESKRYDMIFMDHLMPVMDGIECLHAIRMQAGGLNRNTPIVVLTANAGGENQALYNREGFDGYLLKPVSGELLESELLKHLPRELVTLASAGEFNDVLVGPVLAHGKKRPLLITTDSVSDFPESFAKDRHIAVLPYHIITEGGEFKAGEEIETDGVLSYLAQKNKIARSEEPSVSEYEQFFAEQLTKAQHIIHISMAKNASRGYEKALEASSSFDNVTVVDSGHLSSGMGLIVLKAAEYAAQGMSAEAVLAQIELLKAKTRTTFVVGSTEYLARSGRIPQNVNKICELFMMRPVIKLKKSNMKVAAIHIGNQSSVRKKYINAALKHRDRIDRKTLFITYAGMSPDELDNIAKQVNTRIKFDRVIYQKASPAISINCGPNSFGLLFMEQ